MFLSAAFFMLFRCPVALSRPRPSFESDNQRQIHIVQRELDCVEASRMKNVPCSWEDICYTGTVYHGASRQRAVEEALDKQESRRRTSVKIPGDPIYVESPVTDMPVTRFVGRYDFAREDLPALPLDEDYGYLDSPSGGNKKPFRIGPYISMIQYKEPGVMKETGMMCGLQGAYTHRFHENPVIRSFRDIFTSQNKINLVRVDGLFSWGYVDYEGSHNEDDIRDYMVETRGVFGYDINMPKGLRVTPYVGFGYRYLNDGFDKTPAKTVNGVNYYSGYERESRYYYVPFGFEGEKKMRNDWALEFMFEYDFFSQGEQKSHLEDQQFGGVNPGYDTLTNDQSEGYGLKSSVGMKKESGDYDFFFETFLRYWWINDSNVEFLRKNGALVPVPGQPGYYEAGYEPENNSTEFGIRVGANF